MTTLADLKRFDIKTLRGLSKDLRRRAVSVTRSIAAIKDNPLAVGALKQRRSTLLDAAHELDDMAEERERELE